MSAAVLGLADRLQDVLDAAVHALEAEQDNNTDTALRSYAQVKARLCWVKDEVALLDPVELFLLASQQSPCESLAAPSHFGMPHLLMSPPSRTSELLETLQQSEVMALLMEVCSSLQATCDARIQDLQQTDPPASPPASHRAIVKEEQAAVKQHQLQLPPCPHPFARPPTGSYPLREPLLINDTPNSTATLLNVFQSTGVTTSAGHPSPAWATPHMAALHCPSPHPEASTAQEHHFDVQAMQCSPAYAAQPAGHPEHLRCSREGSLDPDAALLQPHQQGQQGHPQQEHSCLLVAGAKAAGMCEEELSSADPVLKELIQQCRRDVWGSLDDLAGLSEVKKELKQAVFLPLRYPHLFQGLRAPPSNFLFYGPPGTGKTMLVEKVAAQAGLTLLCLPPSVLLSKWSGESEKTLRAAFKAAKLLQPCAIFLDEIDSLAPQRGASSSSGEDAASRRLLTELLIQMSALASSAQRRTATGASPRQSPATSDATKRTSQSAREGHGGCSVPASRSAGSARSLPVRRTGAMLPLDAATLTRPSVYIFAATNRLQDCDTALLRRFERRVHVPLPDIHAREAYFQKVLSKPELAHDIDLASSGPGSSMAQLLAASQGYSCSDLDVIAREAAMAPVREAIDGMEEGDDQHGALQPATSQAAGAAVAAALGEGLPANLGEAMHSCLRLLCLQDFLDAFTKIKPAALDQALAGQP
ncbi:P-loop containing nucleoside triphosphate hydrolase protein [Haematococcus lacustris]